MLEFITAPENFPFAVSLSIVLIIALLEGVGAMLGAGLSNLFHNLFPDSELDFDVQAPDLHSQSALSRALSWLRIGEIPLLVLLIVFLLGFGIIGLMLQNLSLQLLGYMLPALIAAIPAFLCAFPAVRVLGSILNKVIPKDETSAVSTATFIGKVAIITLGKASNNHPAEGKVKDSFGKHHYIMIEPDNRDDLFTQGSEVLLVRQDGTKFYAIKNDHQILNSV